MKKYLKRVVEALTDEKYEGIEFLLTHILFAFWLLVILTIIGIIFQ